jgi:hypothetical protein
MPYIFEFNDQRQLKISDALLKASVFLPLLIDGEEIVEKAGNIIVPVKDFQYDGAKNLLEILEKRERCVDYSPKWYDFTVDQYTDLLGATHFLQCPDIERDLTTHRTDDHKHTTQEFIRHIKDCREAYLRANITFYFKHQETEVALDQGLTRLYSTQKIDFFDSSQDWGWIESILTSLALQRIALESSSFGESGIKALFDAAVHSNPDTFKYLTTLILKGCCSGHFQCYIESIIKTIGHKIALSLQDKVEPCYMSQLRSIAASDTLTGFQYIMLGSSDPLDVDCCGVF